MSDVRPLQDILDTGAGWCTERELAWMGEEITRLRQRVAELEADAARYRWLRAEISGADWSSITGRWPMSDKEADESIDAAIARKENGVSRRSPLHEARGAVGMSDTLPCGHPSSLNVVSAETGQVLYCELCDLRAQRDDAVAMEEHYKAENAALRQRVAELEADAARLDFMQDRLLALDGAWGPSESGTVLVFSWPESAASANLRATIDAAAQESRKENG